MTFADAVALLGIALAVLLYQAQRVVERRREVQSAIDLLDAATSSMPWGELYFGRSYETGAAEARAQADFDAVMARSYAMVFHVPTEPLAALSASPSASGLIDKEVIVTANVALWQVGIFNQFVRQQYDFVRAHLTEILDDRLPADRRELLAKASYAISVMLHKEGIRDGGWWSRRLMRELESNKGDLERRQRSLLSPALALALLLVVTALAAVIWTGIDQLR